jgi:DNA-binding transcriptional ArsR family regulator
MTVDPRLAQQFDEASAKYKSNTTTKSEPSKQSREKAEQVLRQNPLFFVLQTAGKRHLGEEPILMGCTLSAGSLAQQSKKKNVHILTVGISGKGKSSSQDVMASLFWQENTVCLTSTSQKALYYAAEGGAIPNPALVTFEEAEGSTNLDILKRTLTDQSDTQLRNWTVSDAKEFREQVVSECVVTWQNQCETPDDDQLLNRLLIFNVDDSKEMDKAVFEKTKQLEKQGYAIENDEDVHTCRAMFWIILQGKREVMIPFVEDITSDSIGLQNRRSFKKFLKFIRASAVLHLRKREIKEGKILATPSDFAIARLVWDAGADYESSKVPKDCLEVLKVLKEGKELTIEQLSQIMGSSKDTVRRRIKRLKDTGLVDGEVIWDNLKQTRLGRYRVAGEAAPFKPVLTLRTYAGLMQAIKTDVADLAGLCKMEDLTNFFHDSRGVQSPQSPPSPVDKTIAKPMQSPHKPEEILMYVGTEGKPVANVMARFNMLVVQQLEKHGQLVETHGMYQLPETAVSQ